MDPALRVKRRGHLSKSVANSHNFELVSVKMKCFGHESERGLTIIPICSLFVSEPDPSRLSFSIIILNVTSVKKISLFL